MLYLQLGLGIRGAYLGYQPPTAFVAVSMISIGIIMVGWRSLFAYAMADKVRIFCFPSCLVPYECVLASVNLQYGTLTKLLIQGKSLDPKKQGSGNKKGNPFDFLKLLFNLTQRW